MIVGLVMVWQVPPFQKADEVVHFQNTATVVAGKQGVVQKRYLDLPGKLKVSAVAFKYDKKTDSRRIWEKDENKELVSNFFYLDWKSYISYFPVEVGFWMGSFSAYPVMSLYLGRMAGLILFLVCIWLSIRLIPKKYTGLIIVYAMIPMVIHQVTEVSYDVLLLCLAPLILAIFLKILRLTNYWKWLVMLTLLVGLFMLVKPGYYPMILLLPVVGWAKFKNIIISKPWIVGVVVFACIPIVLIFSNFLSNNVGGGTTGLINGRYQLEIVKHDPIHLLRIVGDTWEAKRDFYLRGMLGYFGWLDYEFDLYQYFILVSLISAFLVVTIDKLKKPLMGWFGLIVSGIIIISTYILIEIGFLMQWTVVGSTIVEGVQGRYLLPVVPLLLFWISQFWLLLGKRRATLIVFGLVATVFVFGISDKINGRYYDLSTNYKNKTDLEELLGEKSYLSSKNKLKKMFHTSDGDVIGGFGIVTNKVEDTVVRVPYRYAIKDADCAREYRWGYLDLNRIGKEELYIQKIDKLARNFGDICLEIEPIVISDKEKYFDYVLIQEEPIVKILFLSSEVN